MKPAVEWVSRPRRPSELLPSRRAATSSGSVTSSKVEPSTNSPGCRMNGSVGVDLDEVGEVGLVFGRVDERVLVVVEQPKEAVEPHVDARGLHHVEVERVEADPASVEFGPDVAIAEQHGIRLTKSRPQGAQMSKSEEPRLLRELWRKSKSDAGGRDIRRRLLDQFVEALVTEHSAQPGVHRELNLGVVQVTIEIVNERFDAAIGDVVEGGVVANTDRGTVLLGRRRERDPAGVHAIDGKRRVVSDRNVGRGEAQFAATLITVNNSAAKTQRRWMPHEANPSRGSAPRARGTG